MRKQLYMWRHLKKPGSLIERCQKQPGGPNNAGGALNQNPSGAIYDLQKKMREMGKKRYCIIWMFIWIMLLICWPKLACLNTEVQLQSQADCNETSVLTMHDKSHWPDSGFTRLFFFLLFLRQSLPPPLSCPLLLSRVWDDSHSVEGNRRCV